MSQPPILNSDSLAFVNEERSWKACGRTLRYVNIVSLPLGGKGVFTTPVQTCSVTYFYYDSHLKPYGHFSLFRGSQFVLSHTHTYPGLLRKWVGLVYQLCIPCFHCGTEHTTNKIMLQVKPYQIMLPNMPSFDFSSLAYADDWVHLSGAFGILCTYRRTWLILS